MAKWIKTTHKYPDSDRMILLYTAIGDMMVGYYNHEIKEYIIPLPNDPIAYWAETPLPPKGIK